MKNFVFAVIIFVWAFQLAWCAGVARGVTEAIINQKQEDTRKCYIKGKAFPGISQLIERTGSENQRTLKILMVHGIGSHKPGYSTRLAENLARILDLKQIDADAKMLHLTSNSTAEEELGILIINRYINATTRQEIIFAELTWDTIVESEKSRLDFDNSGEFSFRRTDFNNSLKFFVNDTIPDVLMYHGLSRIPIQLAIGQSMCWLINFAWDDIPRKGRYYCDGEGPNSLARIDDEFVFITHSLGSRITVDALQLIAAEVSKKANASLDYSAKKKILQEKDFTVFMLSNQLPLLQMGQSEPLVSNRIADICFYGEGSSERMFKEVRLIAFSDPNDLFSYAIPKAFVEEHIDSRLCPSLTNVIINVAHVKNVLGTKFANPLSAHTEYDMDERVLDLVAFGVGTSQESDLTKDRCEWFEEFSNR